MAHYVRIEKQLGRRDDEPPKYQAFCQDCGKEFPKRTTLTETESDAARHRQETSGGLAWMGQ